MSEKTHCHVTFKAKLKGEVVFVTVAYSVQRDGESYEDMVDRLTADYESNPPKYVRGIHEESN